jgi:uncharacterized protein (TIGR03437 family)
MPIRYPSRLPVAGDSVTIYATGINSAQKVLVSVGGVESSPQSVTAVPGVGGLYQVSLTLPPGAGEKRIAVSLKILEWDGSAITSNEVWIE